MLKIKIPVMLALLLITFMFMSCQSEQNPVEPFFNSNQTGLTKLIIPINATIDSAHFYINVTEAYSEEITLHRVTNFWDEQTVTWNNFGGGFNADIDESFIPTVSGWYSVDITALVSEWLDQTFPNYGLLLKEEFSGQSQTHSSRESGDVPYLKIWWTLNGSSGYDSTSAFADTYIQLDLGDVNFGSSLELLTGWQDTVETQTLVRFELELVDLVYTHSKGYWKTHSYYGPAPYDSIWKSLGEDSTFFLSNKTNYEVMWTPPKGGNTYYILAHQYIATKLNLLGGADPTEVQEAFDNATDLFSNYTPEDIKQLKGNDPIRKQFLKLKDILDQYNNGIIGPGKFEESPFEYDEYKYIMNKKNSRDKKKSVE